MTSPTSARKSEMNIFHRPPGIGEDALHYTLYPPLIYTDKTSATSLAACIKAHVESLLPDFLWHRDAFELKVVQDSDAGGGDRWMLEGRMRVGDSIDDEWCVVWLLKEISAKWDAVIGVYDSDGDFLLIEAADALPAWIQPSNSENRVWIFNSHLHLIPLSFVSPSSSSFRKRRKPTLFGSENSDGEDNVGGYEDDEPFLCIKDALALVRDQRADTRAPEAMEQIVWRRISGYPTALRNHVHITKAHLPVDIASALSSEPALVQKAIEIFYTRDATQLRASHRMSRFPPEPSVLTTVAMTRTGYAQLVGQRFYPPRPFGTFKELEGSKEWKWRDIGMKIACGFEMLYQESKRRTDISVEAIQSSDSAKKDALARDPAYMKYKENLVSAGYFKGEREGSQLWKMLEDKAVRAFISTQRHNDSIRLSFTAQVTAAISKARDNPMHSREEDSEDWLQIDTQHLDNMLEGTLGTKSTSDREDVQMGEEEVGEKLAKDQAARLVDLAKKVEAFVEGEGGLEGAQFEDEEFSDEDVGMDDTSDSGDSDDMGEIADRKGKKRLEDDDTAARQAAMDRLVPALDPSDFGRMPPSFHENSQRVARPTEDVVEQSEPSPSATGGPAASPPRPKHIRAPILVRDRYEGVDSDDETDSEEERLNDAEDDEAPQVVGEVEIDMGEEADEFLEFSRQALGISDEQWRGIVQDRRARGAFIPTGVSSNRQLSTEETAASTSSPGACASGLRPNVNRNLDSFEAVLQAMDEELAQAKAARKEANRLVTKDGGDKKAKEEDTPHDIEAAMDQELKAALEREASEEDDNEDEEPMDYGLIKNFLESFKSQAGMSGPVSTLAGRLQSRWSTEKDQS